MNLENLQGAGGPSQITHQRCHFRDMSRKRKATETESRLVVAGAAGGGGCQLMGKGASSWGEEDVLALDRGGGHDPVHILEATESFTIKCFFYVM